MMLRFYAFSLLIRYLLILYVHSPFERCIYAKCAVAYIILLEKQSRCALDLSIMKALVDTWEAPHLQVLYDTCAVRVKRPRAREPQVIIENEW